jgi:hypothetical protein
MNKEKIEILPEANRPAKQDFFGRLRSRSKGLRIAPIICHFLGIWSGLTGY